MPAARSTSPQRYTRRPASSPAGWRRSSLNAAAPSPPPGSTARSSSRVTRESACSAARAVTLAVASIWSSHSAVLDAGNDVPGAGFGLFGPRLSLLMGAGTTGSQGRNPPSGPDGRES
jgi:hypothetical protein